MFEIFIYGVMVGFFLNPFLTTLTAILTNAWNRTSACHGDCNQGRNCTCKDKQNGIS
jgi:hypothetical protein